MTKAHLARIYRSYIACLNAQAWEALGRYVHATVSHNGNRLGVAGYREMLQRDFTDIPDLQFTVELLVVEPPNVACRLAFNCTPRSRFLNIDVGGLKISFAEHVFYEFLEEKIVRVWSVVDRAEIEAQVRIHGDSSER